MGAVVSEGWIPASAGMTGQEGEGTLTPFVPLSLRAFKGEGEGRIEAGMGALHPCRPLLQYWGEG